jgi:hypothetical protein
MIVLFESRMNPGLKLTIQKPMIMKTANNYLAGILISSILLASCSKENQQVAPNNTNLAARAVENEIMTIHFSEGHVMATGIQITLDGQEKYSTSDAERINLFEPISDRTQIRPVDQQNLSLFMRAHPRDGQESFNLRGVLTSSDGSKMPISFSILAPVNFYSQHERISIDGGTGFINLMNITTTMDMQNITPDMWRSAVNADGEIVINNKSNPELYSIMLEQLKTMLKIQIEK